MVATSSESAAVPRRVLATRNAGWARSLARRVAAAGVKPNTVSTASVFFGCVAGAAFLVSSWVAPERQALFLILAAATIQLRLLCNLLDGMLAVEEGLKTRSGEIFNDLPDRIADVLILAGAGYAIPHVDAAPTLGWTAAVLALLTAYVRVLAGSLGLTQHFIGPMAKQHRMFALTVAALVGALEAALGLPPRALVVGLSAIVLGSLMTIVRRTRRMFREAEAR
jgi:phosphatidylglycerophosphate synthase